MYLYNTYPIEEDASREYIRQPGLIGALPVVPGPREVMYATVKNPSATVRADPFAAYERAFFQNWMLEAEAALFKKLGYGSPRPSADDMLNARAAGEQPTEEQLGGYFPVVHREPNALLVWFEAPSKKPEEALSGIQVIGASNLDDGNVEIAYGSVALPPPHAQEGKIVHFVHRMYMRYLIDSAKHKMEKIK